MSGTGLLLIDLSFPLDLKSRSRQTLDFSFKMPLRLVPQTPPAHTVPSLLSPIPTHVALSVCALVSQMEVWSGLSAPQTSSKAFSLFLHVKLRPPWLSVLSIAWPHPVHPNLPFLPLQAVPECPPVTCSLLQCAFVHVMPPPCLWDRGVLGQSQPAWSGMGSS